MSGVNRVILVGSLGNDPEIKMMTNGTKVANLSIATSETWKDKQSGERQEKVEWHRVIIFNNGLSEVAEKYLHKGDKVYVEGSLQTRKWTDKDGKEQRTTEIVLKAFKGELTILDTKGKGQTKKEPEPMEEPDDKIPF